MKAAWTRLEDWLRDNIPVALSVLRNGVSDKELDRHEKQIGHTLPEEVREWFRIHDGQEFTFNSSGIIFGIPLLSLTESLEEWEHWRECEYLNEEMAEDAICHPQGAIKLGYAFPGWIPLTKSSGIGNHLGIDLNPGPSGKRGQVINFGRDEYTKVVVAPTWSEFINLIAGEYEAGNVRFEADDTGFDIGGHKQFPIEPGSFRLAHFHDVLVRLHELGRFDGEKVRFTR